MNVFDRIKDLLSKEGIAFQVVRHEPTYTSEASAAARGEALSTGGKAIVMKLDESFKLFVIAADLRIDSGKLKTYFKVRKLRFATPDELLKLTGLVPGSVPPFGRPVLNFDLFVDRSVTMNVKIAFNAGSLTDSIVMNTVDYLRVSGGTILSFGKNEQS